MDRVKDDRNAALRAIPSLDAFVRRESFVAVPRPLLLREARRFLDELRVAVQDGRTSASETEALCASPSADRLVLARCEQAAAMRHRRVINATGVVLHTGIGRAPLARAARAAVYDAAGYAVVEVDPETGKRNQREEAVAELVCALTGAAGALVVNNNAAMTLLVLVALAHGKEVIVSRGELVEIGGGFRMPDVMAQAGARLIEVGTTNRTTLADYERHLGGETAMLLKVHPSNFRMLGFTHAPALAELAALARRRGIYAFEDLGSGLLWDGAIAGLEEEPRVRGSLAAGPHLVCFSGDKLLGGPQCGILIGEKDLVARVRSHPLYRAVRCDKLALAALEATLRIYRDGDPLHEIPTLAMLTAPADTLRMRAQILAGKLGGEVVASESFAGSGSNPARPLPSFAVALAGGAELCDALRTRAAVFARIAEQQVLLDLRTLENEDLEEVAASVAKVLGTR